MTMAKPGAAASPRAAAISADRGAGAPAGGPGADGGAPAGGAGGNPMDVVNAFVSMDPKNPDPGVIAQMQQILKQAAQQHAAAQPTPGASGGAGAGAPAQGAM